MAGSEHEIGCRCGIEQLKISSCQKLIKKEVPEQMPEEALPRFEPIPTDTQSEHQSEAAEDVFDDLFGQYLRFFWRRTGLEDFRGLIIIFDQRGR